MRSCYVLTALLWAALPTHAAEPPAKQLFGAATAPAAMSAAPIGSYAKGCLAGGTALPFDGPAWQAMRPSRNRMWGHPDLIAFIERLAVAAQTDGWPGLMVGDMAQPRGGPMRTGHASHQIGLDVDLWLTPMPDHRLPADERESLPAVSMLVAGTRTVDPSRFTDLQIAVIRRAALDSEVARIFVHPGIKQAMCERVDGDRVWLGKVRPWWGHDAHFHVRLRCPAGAGTCKDQEHPPPGDGCGDDLAWWLTEEPWRPAPPTPPKPPLTLADLPDECATVLRAR
jgi:penicillin-insensitive murein endopeptidase